MCMKSYMRLRVLFYFSAPTDVAQDEGEEITINIPLIESKKERLLDIKIDPGRNEKKSSAKKTSSY